MPRFCSTGLRTPVSRMSVMSAAVKMRASFGPRPRNSRSNWVKAMVVTVSTRPLVLLTSAMKRYGKMTSQAFPPSRRQGAEDGLR